MAQYEHLPIFKQMLDLTVHIEQTVRYFPRYHKYTLGSELRGFCHHGLGLIAEANSIRDRSRLLLELRNTLERLKIHLVLAKEVQAFNKPRSFYRATEMAVGVSRQNEGWLKSFRPQGRAPTGVEYPGDKEPAPVGDNG